MSAAGSQKMPGDADDASARGSGSPRSPKRKVSGQGPTRNSRGERGEEANVAGNVQKLLEGQKRLEELLVRLTGAELGHEDPVGRRRSVGPRHGSQSADFSFPGEQSYKSSLEHTTSYIVEVPQVREGWQGTDDDLKRACEIERPMLDDDEDKLSETSVPLGTKSSFLAMAANMPAGISQKLSRTMSKNTNGSRGGSTERCMVWSPTSTLRLVMDLASVLVLAYDVLSLPYLLAFEVPQEGIVMQLAMASVIFWSIDLVFRFRTGFWSDGRVEMRPSRIARQYLRSTFSIDISLILVDLVSIALTYLESSQPSEMDAFRLWRIGKVTRIVRCISFLRLRAMTDIMERVSMRSKILQATSMVVYDVVRIVFLILWLNHIIACVWVSLGRSVSGDTGLTWLDAGIGGSGYVPYSEMGDKYQYTTAFHWALTQMTPGSMQVFPLNSTERIFNSIGLIFGVLVFSTLISSISSTVTQFKIGMQSNTKKIEELNRFLRKVSINPSLAIQVRKTVRDRMKYQKPLASRDVEALRLLPLSLQMTLELELCKPHLVLNPYFHFVLAVDTMTAEELCHSCAEFSVLGKSDTLFISTLEAVGIYFVTSGAMNYVHGDIHRSKRPSMCNAMTLMETQHPGELVEPGRWLCEAALWCHWRHTGTAEVGEARSCEVLCLGADKLVNFMKSRPGAIGQMSWAFARSFQMMLSLSLGKDTPRFDRPTDLRMPFSTDEVIGTMPPEAKAFVGHVALRELKTTLRSVRGMAHGLMTSLSEGWPDIERIRDEVDRGSSTVVLSRGSRLGVRRIVTLVRLRLQRDDSRVLVVVRQPDATEGPEAKLPDLRQEEGEYPDECYARLIANHFGSMAPGIVMECIEREDQETFSEELGIYTRVVKVVYNARWEPAPQLVERVLSRRGSLTDSMEPMPPLGVEDCPWDPLQTDEVFYLPGGLMVAWFTSEELERCSAADGSRALTQWLGRLTFPTVRRSERRPTPRQSRRISKNSTSTDMGRLDIWKSEGSSRGSGAAGSRGIEEFSL